VGELKPGITLSINELNTWTMRVTEIINYKNAPLKNQETHERVMAESILLMNNIASDMEGGMAVGILNAKYQAQGKALKARADKLGKPSEVEENRLRMKFEPEMMRLLPRLLNAAEKNGGTMPNLNFGD
jgi:hypothetical protein